MTSASLCAFGYNSEGQCDVPALEGKRCVQLAAGLSHTVLLLEDGTAHPFGYNTSGQCAVPDLGGKRCIQLAAVVDHTVLLLEGGTAHPFGRNNSGECAVPDLGGKRCVQVAAKDTVQADRRPLARARAGARAAETSWR